MGSSVEVYVEVFEIIEYRDGAVFKTKSLGHRWVDGDAAAPQGFIWAPASTKVALELLRQGKDTFRRKEVRL